MRQYPYFVRLFHTSTPLRSVELRMTKESRDLVASTGHLWSLWMKSCSVTFQMKPLEKHFHKILLVFQYFDKVKAEFFCRN